MKIKTVSIDRDGVEVIINKSDFDPNRHTLWGAEPQKTQAFEDDEKGRLIDELAELGIHRDRRSSVESLQDALDEALQ